MSRLVAVDPGSRTTGWVAFDHGKLIYHGVIDNTGNLTPDDTSAEYIRSVYRQITRLHPNTIAVESVTAPKGFKGGVRAPINPEGMAGLGAAWSAVVLAALTSGATLLHVAPAGHGSRPLGAYPAVLVGDRERLSAGWQLRVGGGKLRHARSSFDIGRVALRLPAVAA